MGKKSPSPPPPPDYAGAAAAQGAANKEAAIASSRLNNPNVVNPYGTQTWTEGAEADARPTLTQTFSPEQQALFQQALRTQGLLGGLGEQGASALQGVVGKQLDLSGAPQAPGSAEATRQKVLDAMMSRVDEDTANRRENVNADLIARGIRPGTKAYGDQMLMVDRAYNDARNQALLSAGSEASRDFGLDTQRRKDAIAEMLAQRQTPLNEVSALMSGAQVQNPFAVPGAAQGANIAPPPIFGATQAGYDASLDAYNARAGRRDALTSGLFGLGRAAISAYPFFR
ncbi:MAG: hypothetical protein FJY55_10185 [Betaproteobacteria bacterium]|nr:hypothetical protein [Betaproteobacteria bacterium]